MRGTRGGARPVRRGRWTSLEREIREGGGRLIAGVDEVGRGSLAGPVVACAVIMPPDARALRGVDDSKVLAAPERRRLARLIRERAVAVSVGAASVAEIDRINIYQASALAMRRAIQRLTATPDHVLVDGRPIRTLGVLHTAVVDGDAKCFSIACASIVAKVTRDHLMGLLAQRHPAYAWDRNAGYATRLHVDALRDQGPCAHHRRSFVVKALASQLTLALDERPDAGAAMDADDAPIIDELLATQAGLVPVPTADA